MYKKRGQSATKLQWHNEHMHVSIFLDTPCSGHHNAQMQITQKIIVNLDHIMDMKMHLHFPFTKYINPTKQVMVEEDTTTIWLPKRYSSTLQVVASHHV